MNPLTNVKNITKLNEIELSKGTTDKKSWHDIYKDSAWIFIGGLAYGLTEGDVLAVFSQYGEIVNINLVRDKKTGKIKGFCFLCYANQKSTVLAVDNFNGIKLLNRTIRVDHVSNYKPPKDNEHDDELTKQLKSEGCAPKLIKHETSPVPVASSKKKKSKKEKKKHKKDKKEAGVKSLHKKPKIKKEKHDPGYDKYELPQISSKQSSKSKKSRTSDSESSTSGESSDESFVNEKSQSREKGYERNIEKLHNRTLASDFTVHNKDAGDKYSSSRKRNLKESESDSDDNYVKQKKSKASHNKDENRLSSDVQYNNHRSQHRHKSDSSACSSPDDGRRTNVRKASSYERHDTSHSNSSRNTYMSENRIKGAVRHDSSNSEEAHQSNSRSRENNTKNQDSLSRDRSREIDTTKYSRHENSRYQDYGQRDTRNNRSDREYNGDRSSTYNLGDRRNTDVEDHSRNNYPADRWSNDSKNNRMHYDEQNNPRKRIDQKDRKSYEYKNDSENSNRDSSKYSRSVRNIKSSSTEREDKHYSKHRDRDDYRKDSYDKKRR
uniref:RNA-binding motif protein, X-linked 2 n=1 Tax=Parasteatoda tepidariorum TaxID=114398 RepID=A0A2L2YHD0_PARTP